MLKYVLRKIKKNSLVFNPIRNPHILSSAKVYSQIFFRFMYFSKFDVALRFFEKLFITNQREEKDL